MVAVPQLPAKDPRYRLLKRLAMGGMAEILLAELSGHHGFSKQVVIKRILPHFADQSAYVDMFLDEAKLCSRFKHPNLINVFELTKIEDRLSMVMEYVEGHDVGTLLENADEQRVQFPLAVALQIIASAADALGYAHELRDESSRPLNVVHRDISPGNILVTSSGATKVFDFGIAKHEGRQTLTQANTLKGKLSYMSPEQASGQPLDHRSDIFSLGVVFYELLTTEPCFDGESISEVLNQVRKVKCRPVESIRDDVPEAMQIILHRMLTVKPEHRFQSCAEVRDALLGISHLVGEVSTANTHDFVQRLLGASISPAPSMVLLDTQSVQVHGQLQDPTRQVDIDDITNSGTNPETVDLRKLSKDFDDLEQSPGIETQNASAQEDGLHAEQQNDSGLSSANDDRQQHADEALLGVDPTQFQRKRTPSELSPTTTVTQPQSLEPAIEHDTSPTPTYFEAQPHIQDQNESNRSPAPVETQSNQISERESDTQTEASHQKQHFDDEAIAVGLQKPSAQVHHSSKQKQSVSAVPQTQNNQTHVPFQSKAKQSTRTLAHRLGLKLSKDITSVTEQATRRVYKITQLFLSIGILYTALSFSWWTQYPQPAKTYLSETLAGMRITYQGAEISADQAQAGLYAQDNTPETLQVSAPKYHPATIYIPDIQKRDMHWSLYPTKIEGPQATLQVQVYGADNVPVPAEIWIENRVLSPSPVEFKLVANRVHSLRIRVKNKEERRTIQLRPKQKRKLIIHLP